MAASEQNRSGKEICASADPCAAREGRHDHVKTERRESGDKKVPVMKKTDIKKKGEFAY